MKFTYKKLAFIAISMAFSFNANALPKIDFTYELNAADWNLAVGLTDGDTLTFSFLGTTDLYNIDSSDIYSYKFDLQGGSTGINYYNGTAWDRGTGGTLVQEVGNMGNAFSWNGIVLDLTLGFGATDDQMFADDSTGAVSQIINSHTSTYGYGQLHTMFDKGTGPNSGNLTLAKWESPGVTLSSRTAMAVPEPSMIALFGMGLAGLGYARRRRQS